MRRQKLYSNVIREQNKKISRIPFLPAARNPVGSNNKDNMVPRRKVTEKETERNRKQIREKIRGRERGGGGGRVRGGKTVTRERERRKEKKKSQREYIASSASISPGFLSQFVHHHYLSAPSHNVVSLSQIIGDNSKQCMSLLHPLGNNRLI